LGTLKPQNSENQKMVRYGQNATVIAVAEWQIKIWRELKDRGQGNHKIRQKNSKENPGTRRKPREKRTNRINAHLNSGTQSRKTTA